MPVNVHHPKGQPDGLNAARVETARGGDSFFDIRKDRLPAAFLASMKECIVQIKIFKSCLFYKYIEFWG